MQSKDLTAHAGVYIEKGMGLIIPGLTPDNSGGDLRILSRGHQVAAGIFAFGFLLLHFDAHGGRADLTRRVHGQERRG